MNGTATDFAYLYYILPLYEIFVVVMFKGIFWVSYAYIQIYFLINPQEIIEDTYSMLGRF
jgi:hypothetical protein